MMKDNRKLIDGHKIEVKSLEDGFLGSWHPATVVTCEKSARVVQYDHLLNDHGSSNLIERVEVSPTLDGVPCVGFVMSHLSRGRIRPVPPPCVLSLHYGQCVDMLYNDAWWEGVVFDHEDGCENRRIFFPDMGDELVGHIDQLRVSQDWDEVTEVWKPRGNWMLLELIEETEERWPIPVSAKQIWYEMRMESGFVRLKGWTCLKEHIWRELLKQVISLNYKIFLHHIFNENGSNPSHKLSDSKLDAVLQSEGLVLMDNPLAVMPYQNLFQLESNKTRVDNFSQFIHSEQALSVFSHATEILPCSIDEVPGVSPNICIKRAPGRPLVSPDMDPKKRKQDWRSAVPDLVPGAESCPSAIFAASESFKSNRRAPQEVILKVRKHLLHLGWNIEYMRENKQKFRYTSPEEKYFYTLQQLLPHVRTESRPASQTLSLSPIYTNDSLVNACQEIIPSPLFERSPSSRASKVLAIGMFEHEPEYCPEAVKSYVERPGTQGSCKSDIDWTMVGLKAKKHLLSIGWSLYYVRKAAGGRELRYKAPCGKLFNSLRTACIWLDNNPVYNRDYLAITNGAEDVHHIEDLDKPSSPNGLNRNPFSGSVGSLENSVHGMVEKLPNELSDMSLPNAFVPSMEVEAENTRELRKKRKQNNPYSDKGEGLLMQEAKSPHASKKIRGEIHANSSPSVPQSSKRARDVICSSNPNPRSLFSWLIDNNVVAPGSKVCYRKKNRTVLRDGEITRQGIKCTCCQTIFTLSNFELHAGSTYHRPSANIFLADGRSLQECQLELNSQNLKPNSKKGKGRSSRLDNVKGTRQNLITDCVCSVCHVGGDLILCDRCPSVYHTHCLGLMEVPEGDWFCPSCCCKICEIDFGKQSEVLVCGQCEHQYHVECIRAKVIDTTRHPEGYWFCSDACKQVFSFLRKTLGKPFPLGSGRTWTLLKYIQSDSSEHGLENQSKLNVAISVMHECFEPLKDPNSRTDVVEDVIFCKKSNLNRLNFEGFYTVILEEQDQMIAAATVRIFGNEVAEVPLVATRFKYRRLGMCRILMDELEKMLKELGVVRLVLPAIPTVLNTWTSSFGFSKMSESERLNFLDFTFLGFQGTTLCQKILINNPVPTATLNPLTGNQGKIYEDKNKDIVDIEVDRDSLVSEVSQAEEFDIVRQGSARIVKDNNKNHETDSVQLAVTVDQQSPENRSAFHPMTPPCNPNGIVVGDKQNRDTTSNIVTKFYTRRSPLKNTHLSEKCIKSAS